MWYFSKVFTNFLLIVLISAISAKPSREIETKAATQLNKGNDEFPEEDTDMLMEPNDFAPITILRSQERHYHEPAPPTHFRSMSNPRMLQARADLRPIRSGLTDSHTQAAQNYYPPFFREAPPLGHSRPYFPLAEGTLLTKFAESQTANNLGPHQRSLNHDQGILGSGDFGIIRGGTFYPEEEIPYHTEDSIDFVQKYTYPEEQFAQFRDFADINTPVDSAFSQFVVVYENQNNNSSSANQRQIISRTHPKNIFEQLQLLDREEEANKVEGRDEEKKKKSNIISKTKAKLAKTKLELKKYNKKKTNNTTTVITATKKEVDEEPLLALS